MKQVVVARLCCVAKAGRRCIMFFLHVGMSLKSFDLSMPVPSFFCKEVNGLKLERDEGISLAWHFLCCVLCSFQRGGPSSVARWDASRSPCAEASKGDSPGCPSLGGFALFQEGLSCAWRLDCIHCRRQIHALQGSPNSTRSLSNDIESSLLSSLQSANSWGHWWLCIVPNSSQPVTKRKPSGL